MQTRDRQSGAINWRWYIGIIIGFAVAFAIYQWRSGENLPERLGPNVAGLITPATDAIIDVDDALPQFVWQHNESDPTYRADMDFVVCVLEAGETCERPATLGTASFRRWSLTPADLTVDTVPTHSHARQYTFNVPAADMIDYGFEGRALKWAVVACWPNVTDKCSTTPASDFKVTAPNVRAANPNSLSPPGSGVRTGPFRYSVRAHNTSSKDSGPFDYVHQYALILVDATGTPIMDLSAPQVPPNPMYILDDRSIIEAKEETSTDGVMGILLPDTGISAIDFGIAEIEPTMSGSPVAIDNSADFSVTTPVGVVIFLTLDPNNTRVEADETDDYRVRIENAL